MTDTHIETNLGYLLLWRVGEVNVTYDDLEKALAYTGVALPSRPVPVDVFRRVATTAIRKVRLTRLDEDSTLELTVAQADATSDKMITRHVVGTVKNAAGTVEMIRKVGDFAFYKPPRGQHSKARMRVLMGGGFPVEWQREVAEFLQYLQVEYDKGVQGHVDSQAIRRLIRGHLAANGALHLDGPYFAQYWDQHASLEPLFEMLGDDSYMLQVPLPDSEINRSFLERGLTRAVNAGQQVDEALWKILEQA